MLYLYRVLASAVLLASLLCNVGCDRRAKATNITVAPNVKCHTPGCDGYILIPYVLTRTKYGVGCLGNLYGGTTPKPEPPPLSYLAKDIGRPGFPILSGDERQAVLKKIAISEGARSAELRYGSFRRQEMRGGYPAG